MTRSENAYHGINAHLHSLAQNPSPGHPTIWTSFHAAHIGHIIDALNAQLPERYIARAEQSLQIWTGSDSPVAQQARPDVSIYWASPQPTPGTLAAAETNATVRLIPLAEDFAERDISIPSAVIYEVSTHESLGRAITRFELLSASNKRGGSGYDGYQHNRALALASGTSLVELDYLHQSASPLPGLPRYPLDDDSHPYTIAVTDRRPDHNPDKLMVVYIMDVDQPLPADALIPLADGDHISFDFERVYQHTFQAGRWGHHLDYGALPRQFERYSLPDQQRIQAVMQRITSQE